MGHTDTPQFLGIIVVILAAANLLGYLARRIGQPAVNGELIAGVILGKSIFGLVDANDDTMKLLGELGVVVLLFGIGLQTDIQELLRVGGSSTAVALMGVVVPFVLGYAVCRLLDQSHLVGVVAGATLTATGVGVLGRILSDLGRLKDPESQIILGAAVLDDLIGLIILSVVTKLAQGDSVSTIDVVEAAVLAFGFLIGTLLLGGLIVPRLAKMANRFDRPGTACLMAVMLALGLGWLAWKTGSAVTIGAFAAGLFLRKTSQIQEIEQGVVHLGRFFIPIFFVVVGASVDLSVFNPLIPDNRHTLLIGGLLTVAAIVGKFVAGYAPFWFRGRKSVIGVGMIPRGAVGIIFAQMGLSSGVFDARLFSAAILVVMVTTFMTPPLLKHLYSQGTGPTEPSVRNPSDELVVS